MWRKHGLLQTEVHQELHLPQTLERGGFRIRRFTRVRLRRDVAKRQPRVTVCRSDNAIEVDFVCAQTSIPGEMLSGNASSLRSSDATGQLQ